ncbi:glycosyltransferase, partial [Escherichia coli]|nr:glycosyltransferase [Escherichia coli]
ITIHKNLFSKMGYKTSNVKIKNILSRNQNIFVCNWVEDNLKGTGLRLILNILKFSILCLYGVLAAKKFIWVRHNLKPHNDFRNQYVYKLGLNILHKIADVVIYHGQYKINDCYRYIPHPLYMQEQINPQISKTIDFAFYGKIARYKGLVDLLNNWPQHLNLLIRGSCDDPELKQEIAKIIDVRGLERVVSLNYGYIEHEDLNAMMYSTKYLILPHEDQSMIVSGAFYHGISYGANIIAKESSFSKSMAKKYPFCTTYNNENLQDVLSSLKYIEPHEVKEISIKAFGEDVCMKEWKSVFA